MLSIRHLPTPILLGSLLAVPAWQSAQANAPQSAASSPATRSLLEQLCTPIERLQPSTLFCGIEISFLTGHSSAGGAEAAASGHDAPTVWMCELPEEDVPPALSNERPSVIVDSTNGLVIQVGCWAIVASEYDTQSMIRGSADTQQPAR